MYVYIWIIYMYSIYICGFVTFEKNYRKTPIKREQSWLPPPRPRVCVCMCVFPLSILFT